MDFMEIMDIMDFPTWGFISSRWVKDIKPVF